MDISKKFYYTDLSKLLIESGVTYYQGTSLPNFIAFGLKIMNICIILGLWAKIYSFRIRPKNTCVSTNPTDPVFFCTDPAICIAFQKKK